MSGWFFTLVMFFPMTGQIVPFYKSEAEFTSEEQCLEQMFVRGNEAAEAYPATWMEQHNEPPPPVQIMGACEEVDGA